MRAQVIVIVAGEDWLSWLWIDTKDAAVAAEAVKRAKAAGAASRRLLGLAWLGLAGLGLARLGWAGLG